MTTPPPRASAAAIQRPRVLVVDDELPMAEMLADGLGERGYDAVPVSSSRTAAKMLEEGAFVALVTELRMPEMDGLELLAASRRLAPERPVIVMTAYSALDTAIESIRRGAYHYATKPFKLDEIALFLGRALEEAGLRREATSLKRALRERHGLTNIVGQSPAMREVTDLVERVVDAGRCRSSSWARPAREKASSRARSTRRGRAPGDRSSP